MENVATQSHTPPDPNAISGEPTKEFFIMMLTRDIPLVQAIADLLDNCIDGAKRLRPDGNYTNLWIRLETSQNHFKICDNCGGFDIETARKYAFRFGRPEGMTATPHSIGQFGVGMKRAFFKLGNHFRVESITENTRFVVKQGVREWADNKADWDFRFSEMEEGPQPPERERGTTLEVTDLIPAVASEFASENFRTRLNERLTKAHQDALSKNIAITLNALPLKSTAATMLSGGEITPAKKTLEFTRDNNKVRVILFAGLSHSNPASAGWDIFCNGRLVLFADKTSTSGWGDGVPNYHNEYARFKGYAYFDSDQSSMLPWTTTKSHVDEESDIYRSTRIEMIAMMRPVIDFLARVASEKKKQEGDGLTGLEKKITETPARLLSTFGNQNSLFLSPEIIAPAAPQIPMQLIKFHRPTAQVDAVKKQSGSKSAADAGAASFDYYFKMECE